MWKILQGVRKFALVLALLVGLFFVFRGEMVPELRVYEKAEREGYRDVLFLRRHDHLMMLHGCDPLDATVFEVTAESAAHKREELTLCVGWPFFEDIFHVR